MIAGVTDRMRLSTLEAGGCVVMVSLDAVPITSFPVARIWFNESGDTLHVIQLGAESQQHAHVCYQRRITHWHSRDIELDAGDGWSWYVCPIEEGPSDRAEAWRGDFARWKAVREKPEVRRIINEFSESVFGVMPTTKEGRPDTVA